MWYHPFLSSRSSFSTLSIWGSGLLINMELFALSAAGVCFWPRWVTWGRLCEPDARSKMEENLLDPTEIHQKPASCDNSLKSKSLKCDFFLCVAWIQSQSRAALWLTDIKWFLDLWWVCSPFLWLLFESLGGFSLSAAPWSEADSWPGFTISYTFKHHESILIFL